MTAVVRITFRDNLTNEEFRLRAEGSGLSIVEIPKVRGVPGAPEILIALGSAGIFSTLFQLIAAMLKKDADREVSITRENVSVVLKGHSLPEERQLLRELAPEFVGGPS